jgi:hypothetical protein
VKRHPRIEEPAQLTSAVKIADGVLRNGYQRRVMAASVSIAEHCSASAECPVAPRAATTPDLLGLEIDSAPDSTSTREREINPSVG